MLSDVLSFNDAYLFFFSSRRRHTRLQGDWSSDVCSSDLTLRALQGEMDAAFGRVDGLSRGAIDEAATRAERIVDRAFLRAAELALGLAALTILAALVVARALGVRTLTARRT